jgi:hypothetical protein
MIGFYHLLQRDRIFLGENTQSDASLQRALDWIRECTGNHAICGKGEARPLPTRILDIGGFGSNRVIKLVESKGLPAKYAAISHCWGSLSSDPLILTKNTLEAFKNGSSWNQLPRLFQETIDLVQRLGIRYIWIDSLCIIQDDVLDWQQESAMMCSVYSNSYVTIAATGAGNHDKSIYSQTPPEF